MLLLNGATTVASGVDTVLKEQFTQKWKSAENHPQDIQDEFVSLCEQI